MAPMGVSSPIGLTNHGGVEALGLLCARCGGLLIFACPEVVNFCARPYSKQKLGKKRACDA
eukprot:4641995-Prymnesium_polylepis.1